MKREEGQRKGRGDWIQRGVWVEGRTEAGRAEETEEGKDENVQRKKRTHVASRAEIRGKSRGKSNKEGGK
jgi:hypothetical protein